MICKLLYGRREADGEGPRSAEEPNENPEVLGTGVEVFATPANVFETGVEEVAVIVP